MDHFVTEHDDDGRNVETRAAGQQSRDQEDRRGGVAGGDAKADLQELVNGDDVVVVKGSQEKIGDDDAGDDRADGELDVGEVVEVITLAGCAEKRCRTQFRRDDRGEHGPPGQLATADAELAHAEAALARRGEAHADNEGEVGKNGESVPEILHLHVIKR